MSACITGIGSRKTPGKILQLITEIGLWCHKQGIWVRSGHAPGADKAFEYGARSHAIVYLPWHGFNGPVQTKHVVVWALADWQAKERARWFTRELHPKPSALTEAMLKLMDRNYFQVCGSQPEKKLSNAIVCYTPKGKGGGGTGQAIRIANHYSIPVLDLGLKENQSKAVVVYWLQKTIAASHKQPRAEQ